MKINSYFINQYRDCDFLRYNQVKFKTICIVLDFFAFCGGANKELTISRIDIEKKIYAAIKDSKFNRAAVNNALAAMEVMGQVKEEHGNIIFLEKGFQDYQSQSYHQIAASLTEAKQTRVLSFIAIIISVFAILLNLLNQFI